MKTIVFSNVALIHLDEWKSTQPRITREHRLVYEVTEKEIRILSCKFHYD